MGSFRSGPEVSKSKEEAKKTADSILRVINRNRSKFNSLLSLSSDEVSNEMMELLSLPTLTDLHQSLEIFPLKEE